MRFDLTQQFHDLRFVAWLGGIGVRNNSFDFDSDNELIRADQSRASNSPAGDMHC